MMMLLTKHSISGKSWKTFTHCNIFFERLLKMKIMYLAMSDNN